MASFRPPRAAGFSLIEVLITVFVVAVGLLSVAGLQALSKKSNYDAIQRTLASTLAQDIIERMRANPAQISLYLNDPVNGVSEINPLSTPGTLCSTTTTPTAPACSPTQIAPYDMYQWSQALFGAAETGTATTTGTSATNAGGLAAATGCITQGANACIVTVAIAWRGVTPLQGANTGSGNGYTCGSARSDNAYDAPGDTPGSGRLRRLLIVTAAIDVPLLASPCAASGSSR